MYNRYIRNDHGTYTRIPEEDPSRRAPPPDGKKQQPSAAPNREPPPGGAAGQPPPRPTGGDGPPHATDSLTGFLQHILDQFHLDSVDTGDLLLLAILFFLFREGADEELLVALGLLLIL